MKTKFSLICSFLFAARNLVLSSINNNWTQVTRLTYDFIRRYQVKLYFGFFHITQHVSFLCIYVYTLYHITMYTSKRINLQKTLYLYVLIFRRQTVLIYARYLFVTILGFYNISCLIIFDNKLEFIVNITIIIF